MKPVHNGKLIPNWKSTLEYEKGWKRDKWGNWKNKKGNRRLKIKKTVARLEHKLPNGQWVRQRSFLLPKKEESYV